MVELLRRVDVLSPLREYELDTIARHCEFTAFVRGQVIFTQGSAADSFHVVDRGRVGIITVDHEGADAVIAHIAESESFGEIDFLARSPRSATALADVDSVLLGFPARGHSPETIFREHPYLWGGMLYRLLGVIAGRIWHVNRLLMEKSQWLMDLRKQLLRDKMTGLYNQVFLKEDFVNLLPDFGKRAALLMLKPDNFKDINDRYGHEAGDRVLNLMAIFLQSELGENDIGVRYRGDEYAAILPGAGKDEAVKKAKEINAAFRTMSLSRIIDSGEERIRVSVGIALYPDDAETSAGLVTAAHRKMSGARSAGGNRVLV